ncbi:MAG: hypothetical protein WKI50_00630, partial [Aquificaceae bacterium]
MRVDGKMLFPPQGLNYIDTMKKDKKAVAIEFEAILLKEVMKEAFKPMLEGKSFDTKLYYDIFLENLSRKLAEAGGIG